MALTVAETTLAGVRVFQPDVYDDERGFFKETYATAKYHALGLHDVFVQDSVSFSSKNVIRGMHGDFRMSKFVQVLRGKIWDVVVDVREDSPTYLRSQGFILSEHNHRQLYIPAGFAHGFIALTEDVVFQYKHGALYDPTTEFAWNYRSEAFGIAWPLVGEPRVSLKDASAPHYPRAAR
jgi:dTDP-4-dehydrorhamnose 3,5-epimerase